MLEIILVQDFCPLKIKITQFRDGFRLNVSFRAATRARGLLQSV